MTLYDIVSVDMGVNGYDGLYNPDGCCCFLADLAPCRGIRPGCSPGKLVQYEDPNTPDEIQPCCLTAGLPRCPNQSPTKPSAQPPGPSRLEKLERSVQHLLAAQSLFDHNIGGTTDWDDFALHMHNGESV